MHSDEVTITEATTETLKDLWAEAYWEPPEGWRFRTLRHASHECGWSHSHPAWDAGTFRQHCEDHAKTCPWPEPPELVETVSD